MERPTMLAGSTEMTFEIETHDDPVPEAVVLSQYRAEPLLSLPPDSESLPTEEWSQEASRIGGSTGSFLMRTVIPSPVTTRRFEWVLDGAGEISYMQGMVAAFRGRKNGFWVPTYRADLIVVANAVQGSVTLVVEFVGYTESMFPHEARRHLAIFWPSGVTQLVAVTNAVGGVGTETITLDAGLIAPVIAGRGKVSFLLWCRQDSDRTDITFHTTRVATTGITITEIPREVP